MMNLDGNIMYRMQRINGTENIYCAEYAECL